MALWPGGRSGNEHRHILGLSWDEIHGIMERAEGQRESIEATAMDMWDPYVASVREYLREGSQRSSTTNFISPNVWTMLWTKYGVRKTALCKRPAMTD